MFHPRLSHLLALAFVVLSFSVIVWAAPVAVETGRDLIARGGTCSLGCTTGSQTYDILVKLKAAIVIKLAELDGCYHDGTDPAKIIAELCAIIQVHVKLIAALPIDLLGLLNGKILLIVNLCVEIIVVIATHCAKWSDKADFDVFLKLCVNIDIALKALLSTCGGLLGALLVQIALSIRVHVALLLKVKFNLCLGILGL